MKTGCTSYFLLCIALLHHIIIAFFAKSPSCLKKRPSPAFYKIEAYTFSGERSRDSHFLCSWTIFQISQPAAFSLPVLTEPFHAEFKLSNLPLFAMLLIKVPSDVPRKLPLGVVTIIRPIMTENWSNFCNNLQWTFCSNRSTVTNRMLNPPAPQPALLQLCTH